MKILALDTATHTGWAVLAGGVITSGAADFSVRTKATKTIPADHVGRRFALFRNWLNEMVRVTKPDLVAYEAIVGGARAGGNVSLIQKGFESFVLETAFRRDVPVWSFSPATIKKWATGSGKLSHESKAAVVRAAWYKFGNEGLIPHKPTKAQPWSYDDNQCDALWLLDLTQTVIAQVQDDAEPWTDGLLVVRDFDTKCLTLTANQVTAAKWSHAKKR